MAASDFVGIDLHKNVVQISVLKGADQVIQEARHEIKTLEAGAGRGEVHVPEPATVEHRAG